MVHVKHLVLSTKHDKSMLALFGIFLVHPHLGKFNALQALAWERSLGFEQRLSAG